MLPAELFHPKSVAVLGASRNPGKVGHGVFANLVRSGFPGEVYGGNPAGGGGGGPLREHALREALSAASVRAVGPNCLGVINTHAKLNASFSAGTPLPGSIAFFSQSGALCTAILDWAVGAGIGFSKVVSLGNKADISELDLMEYLSDDPETRVILGYVESIDEGLRFLPTAREGTAKKTVILVKAGAAGAGGRGAPL